MVKNLSVNWILKDEEFLSAKNKHLVLKDWIAFIKHGFGWNQFTKRLYSYLIAHAGFIAHYDVHGFFEEYFTTGADKIRFIEQFDRRKIKNNWWYLFKTTGDYSDLNNAMIDELEKFLPVFYAAAFAEQKRLDLAIAEKLLNGYGLELAVSVKPQGFAKETALFAAQGNLF